MFVADVSDKRRKVLGSSPSSQSSNISVLIIKNYCSLEHQEVFGHVVFSNWDKLFALLRRI